MERWPAHRFETVSWRQAQRGGTRADRMLTEITVAVPPAIASLDIVLDAATVAETEESLRQVSLLDATHGSALTALGPLLLRTESVASSKIEAIQAGIDDYARALHGVRANPSASAMAAATRALDLMVGEVGRRGRLELADLTGAHRELMRDDSQESRTAGTLRTVQNWIGGSDFSPRGAVHVPPPPALVPSAMADLVAFANRDDLPTLVQAAVAHAQFESIHPFTDGNGRIGRALINTILRRRRATTGVVVPLASALVARRDRYFGLLDDYRHGQVQPLVTAFAEATRLAAVQARETPPGSPRSRGSGPISSGRCARAVRRPGCCSPCRPVPCCPPTTRSRSPAAPAAAPSPPWIGWPGPACCAR